MYNRLKEWAKKVSKTKKDMDKRMFDDVVDTTLRRLKTEGYEKTWAYLNNHYVKGKGNRMVGVILLRNNSKQVRDKLWSLNKQ